MTSENAASLFYRLIFAAVWLVNGIYCKILDQVPRHRGIVAKILGSEHSVVLTQLIGFSEVVMALWILSGYRWKWSCAAQISAVAMMNILEFFLAPDMLLFGHFNALFAFAYIALVAWVGYFDKKS
jgi:hypothetical protein